MPSAADIVSPGSRAVEVRSGIPGTGMGRLEDGRYPYPKSTGDIVKLLRATGFDVTFDHDADMRAKVSLNTAEDWLPVLVFAQSVLANVPANILSSLFLQYIGAFRLGKTTLHVEFFVKASDGSEEQFEAHGPGDKVVDAINAFQRRYHD